MSKDAEKFYVSTKDILINGLNRKKIINVGVCNESVDTIMNGTRIQIGDIEEDFLSSLIASGLVQEAEVEVVENIRPKKKVKDDE